MLGETTISSAIIHPCAAMPPHVTDRDQGRNETTEISSSTTMNSRSPRDMGKKWFIAFAGSTVCSSCSRVYLFGFKNLWVGSNNNDLLGAFTELGQLIHPVVDNLFFLGSSRDTRLYCSINGRIDGDTCGQRDQSGHRRAAFVA